MNELCDAPARARTRPRRRRPHIAALTAALVIGLLGACTPPTPEGPPSLYGLRSTLGDGEITLTWHAPNDEAAANYDVEVLTDGVRGWQHVTTTPNTTTTFTDVTNRTRYSFRVRAAVDGSTPPSLWSPPIPLTTYVDLLLPVVRIDTTDRAPIRDKDNYVPGTVSIDPNGSEFAEYSGTMGIKGRGNSTWGYAKKPYRIKLDSKSPIMGIASEKDWVLLANAVDRSQLRTYAAMQASGATSLGYTPTLRTVEVVLNGEYNGVYTLTQHNEIGRDRVDITEMEGDDNSGEALTGGYRLEIDERLEENNEPGWRTPRQVPVVIKDPDPATPAQFGYIRDLVNAFENSMFTANFADPVTGYRQYMDVENFIDQYLVQELTHNQDAFFSSTYFTKERGENKLRFGPVWDFDNSMGNVRAAQDLRPEGWWVRTRGPWMQRVFADPTFVAEVAQRWNQLKGSFDAIGGDIEALGAELQPAIANDASKWVYEPDETDAPEFLSDWLDARIAWMDGEYHPAP